MATRGSILTGRKTAPAFRAPVVRQMAPVSIASPADVARIQQEQSKAMLQQPQQPSGLKALSPQEYRSVHKQPSGLKAVAPAVVAPAATNTYNKTQQDAIRKAQQSMAMLQQPQMPGASAPSNLDALMASFNKSQQTAAQNFNQKAAFNQSQQAAAQVPQSPSKAMLSYQEAVKAGTAGDMAKPAFKKGGVVKKKPGYAKGGAVAKKTAASKYAKGGMAMPKASNCGASMKPQQRKK